MYVSSDFTRINKQGIYIGQKQGNTVESITLTEREFQVVNIVNMFILKA